MAVVRSDINIDFYSSPRIFEIDKTQNSITVQETVNICREIEYEWAGLSWPHLINAAGKENLGGGVLVGITATMQNTLIAFEERVAVIESGTVTNPDINGITLEDSTALFETNLLDRGDIIYNVTDGSRTTVLSVSSETILITKGLIGGTNNQWNAADSYEVYDVEQCNSTGGNLVAIDGIGNSIDPILPTFGTQVVRTSSSSATLQELTSIQHSSFNNGVTIDVTTPNTGTIFPTGTNEKPVNNIADALSIAQERGFSRFYILGNITLSSGMDVTNYEFVGESVVKTTITINPAAVVDGIEVFKSTVTGTLDNISNITGCKVLTLNSFDGLVENGILTNNTITMGAEAHFVDCHMGELIGVPKIDMGGDLGDLLVINYSGNIQLNNMTGTNRIAVFEMISGRVTVDASCTAGNVVIAGSADVIDNSTGTCTVDMSKVNQSLVWNEPLTDYNIDGSMGNTLAKALGLMQENYALSSPTYDSNSNLTSATVKTYPTKADQIGDTNVLATYTVSATFNTSSELQTYSMVKE